MTDLSLGHLAADFAQGALPAILVFLKPVLHLSYTMTAAVVLVGTVTSSIAQPIFGNWSDRRGAVWLMPAGVVVSCVGISLVRDRAELCAAAHRSSRSRGSGSARSTPRR